MRRLTGLDAAVWSLDIGNFSLIIYHIITAANSSQIMLFEHYHRLILENIWPAKDFIEDFSGITG